MFHYFIQYFIQKLHLVKLFHYSEKKKNSLKAAKNCFNGSGLESGFKWDTNVLKRHKIICKYTKTKKGYQRNDK